MDLSDKVAVIVGGARMGASIARALAQRDCSVVLTYRRSKRAAAEVVKALRQEGYNALSLRCDASKPATIRQAFKSVARQWSRIDFVINLASVYESVPLRDPKSAKSWSEHIAANAWSAWSLSIEAAKFMAKDGGRLIHTADWTSASGRPRYRDYAAYYVSKRAVQGVVEAMALELAPKILVNAIAPGPMIPPPGLSTSERRAVERATPLGRWGGADEMTKAILFLIDSDFLTGETIRLDGGRHLL